MSYIAPAKLLTITLDRKTGKVISQKLEETNETFDFSVLIDIYYKQIIEDIKKGVF